VAPKTTRVVADASVIAKWFLEESGREHSLRLRTDFVAGAVGIACPALMPFEVMNAIRYSKKSLPESRVKALGRSLSLYGIELYHLKGEYLEMTLEASMRNGLTVYDGSYLALARTLGSVLYTADESLISSLGRSEKTLARHIEEYSRQTA